ncbi:DNA alkylation repair protein [Lactobacillus hominis]|uniref:DNA alkylation repair protein n=1 Tax=Lactobacillus hominis TaxID=1203033 RepID=UPI0023EFA4AC|nr:DNA alkylation repair protein [Lactobacillus hominis]
MNYQELINKFEAKQNPENSQHMKAYMRDQFDFYGYQSASRKQVYHQVLLAEKKQKTIDWNLLNQAWKDPHRELQYFVCDYLIAMQKFLQYEDMPQIKHYAVTKSWWDTIDSLIKPIGKLGLRDKRINDLMLNWSQNDNIWLRRIAIEHQLLRKKQTNTELLAQIIENNIPSQEFFINKAIGWALRDYSKTDPKWVRNFLENHLDLKPLSVKEASKYLDRKG